MIAWGGELLGVDYADEEHGSGAPESLEKVFLRYRSGQHAKFLRANITELMTVCETGGAGEVLAHLRKQYPDESRLQRDG